jgi:hypothetical protein
MGCSWLGNRTRSVILSVILGALTTAAIAWGFAILGTPRDSARIVAHNAVRALRPSEGKGFLLYQTVKARGMVWTRSSIALRAIVGQTYLTTRSPEQVGAPWPEAFRVPWGDHSAWPVSGAEYVAYGFGWPCLALRSSALIDCGRNGSPIVESSGLRLPPNLGTRFPSLVLYGTVLLPIRPMWLGFILDAALFSLGWSALVIGLPRIRRIRRGRQGRCVTCGYDVRGGLGPCPECGAQADLRPAPGSDAPVIWE